MFRHRCRAISESKGEGGPHQVCNFIWGQTQRDAEPSTLSFNVFYGIFKHKCKIAGLNQRREGSPNLVSRFNMLVILRKKHSCKNKSGYLKQLLFGRFIWGQMCSSNYKTCCHAAGLSSPHFLGNMVGQDGSKLGTTPLFYASSHKNRKGRKTHKSLKV